MGKTQINFFVGKDIQIKLYVRVREDCSETVRNEKDLYRKLLIFQSYL
jgi:hypothetical protein